MVKPFYSNPEGSRFESCGATQLMLQAYVGKSLNAIAWSLTINRFALLDAWPFSLVTPPHLINCQLLKIAYPLPQTRYKSSPLLPQKTHLSNLHNRKTCYTGEKTLLCGKTKL